MKVFAVALLMAQTALGVTVTGLVDSHVAYEGSYTDPLTAVAGITMHFGGK